MINRFLIRIKTVHLVYSYIIGEYPKYICDEELTESFTSSYTLYNYLLGLVVKVTDYRRDQLDKARNKYLPTKEERFPNERFVNNGLARIIKENSPVMDYCEEHQLFNDFDTDLYRDIFEQIEQNPLYLAYMSQPTKPDFAQDRELWKEIFNNIIPKCPALDDMLENKNIYWNDDLTTIIQFVIKTLNRIKPTDEMIKTLDLFRTDDDRKFAFDLMHYSIDQAHELMQLIDDNATNWEVSRIAIMEKVIMLCALAEIRNFPEIPVKISLNEYIEIAKYYCSGESARFINGILDKIVSGWKANGELNKWIS